MEERELFRDLSRMIRGELTSTEVQRIVSREGFSTFSELCERRLPEDLAKIRIGTRDILTRIDRYRRRQIDLYELWYWADELYNISFNHRISFEGRTEELITAALSAISVIANERLFPNIQKTQRALEYIRACLLRRRKLQLRNIFIRIFEDMELSNLAVKQGAKGAGAEPDEDEARWADVVLLDRPWREGSDLYSDYNWMIAFTVTAKSLYEQERAEDAAAGDLDESGDYICPECAREARRREEALGEKAIGEDGPPAPPAAETTEGEPFHFAIPGWTEGEGEDDDDAVAEAGEIAHPRIRPTPRPPGDEIDRVPALRRLVPNFNFGRFSPKYLYDGDGIAEIGLDVPKIGQAEIDYAAKLWCLANRVREARLHGERVKALIVKPGAGKRGG